MEVTDREQVVLPDEADRVRHVFRRYLELGSVYALQAELADQDIRTKARIGRDGRHFGNAKFSRGALYLMLRNRIYLGEICHKGKGYPGEHEAIVDPALFEQVGCLLDSNRVDNRDSAYAEQPSLLCGIVWDSEGRRMTPNHANKKGVRYRYYISRKDKERLKLPVWRVPAGDLETLVALQTERCMGVESLDITLVRGKIGSIVERVIVHSDRIEIRFTNEVDHPAPVIIPATLISRGGERRLAVPDSNFSSARRDPALIKLIVRAHQVRKALGAPGTGSLSSAASSLEMSVPYFTTLLRLSHLAPDITAAILDGRQPAHLNRQHLARINNLPIDWAAQREMLGFA